MKRVIRVFLAIFGVRKKPQPAETPKSPIRVPAGIRLFAHEFCSIWDVEAREFMLAYSDVGCPVPYSAEVIVEHEPDKAISATAFAWELRLRGWKTVTIEPRREVVA